MITATSFLDADGDVWVDVWIKGDEIQTAEELASLIHAAVKKMPGGRRKNYERVRRFLDEKAASLPAYKTFF